MVAPKQKQNDPSELTDGIMAEKLEELRNQIEHLLNHFSTGMTQDHSTFETEEVPAGPSPISHQLVQRLVDHAQPSFWSMVYLRRQVVEVLELGNVLLNLCSTNPEGKKNFNVLDHIQDLDKTSQELDELTDKYNSLQESYAFLESENDRLEQLLRVKTDKIDELTVEYNEMRRRLLTVLEQNQSSALDSS